jgi:hypothetical protein
MNENAPVPPDLQDAFFARWIAACKRLDVDPIDLVRVAYSESGLRASAHNPHGHASGLIQFMPATLESLGWTRGHDAFRTLAPEDQVHYVEAYFRAWAHRRGVAGYPIPQLVTDAHCYVATFLPGRLSGVVAAGEGWRDYPLCAALGPLAWAYTANKVLDRDGDGVITAGDLARHIEVQCRGARYEAIVHRMRLAMGVQSIPPPEPAETLRELPADPVEEEDGGLARRSATSEAVLELARDASERRSEG